MVSLNCPGWAVGLFSKVPRSSSPQPGLDPSGSCYRKVLLMVLKNNEVANRPSVTLTAEHIALFVIPPWTCWGIPTGTRKDIRYIRSTVG